MRFGSVCSGIEAASVASASLGWEAAWFSEIEPFPCAVLDYHYTDVPNHGDMALLPKRIADGVVEAPELFVGGTPCQAFSVAGHRKGLDDARGNLTLVFCDIANAIDEARARRGEQPSIIFWENVPGVLSDKSNAFGCFLGAIVGESCELQPPGGKWTNAGCVYGPQRAVAWRILDAQYFGVAQQRKRLWVLAGAGDFDPTSILFESEIQRIPTAKRMEAEPPVGTLTATDSKGPSLQRNHLVVPSVQGDRKLLPVEHERLQGFPDNYTQIPWRGKPADRCPDGPRYKALGNSWAVPCVAWIFRRIADATT